MRSVVSALAVVSGVVVVAGITAGWARPLMVTDVMNFLADIWGSARSGADGR